MTRGGNCSGSEACPRWAERLSQSVGSADSSGVWCVLVLFFSGEGDFWRFRWVKRAKQKGNPPLTHEGKGLCEAISLMESSVLEFQVPHWPFPL